MSGQGVKRVNEGNAGGGGGGGKKMRADSVTLRFLLQSKHAGGIIGKGGQTIKRLRSEYNATVSVPDTNAPERVLSIAAGQENAIDVLRECLPLCHEPPFPIAGGGGEQGSGSGNNQFEINFLVHSSQVGGIIGRAGSNIKELRETTGTNIKVFQECLPNSTERVVAIGAGNEEGVIEVIRRILVIMQEQPIKGNISLYDPSMEPWEQGQGYGGPAHGGGRGGRGGGMRGGGGGRGRGRGGSFGNQGSFGSGGGGGGGNFGGQQDQGNFNYGGAQDFSGEFNQTQGAGGGGAGGEGANYGKGNVETTQVTIPNDLAGAIIGKGGERIRNIRQRSGADIKIQDPLPGKADRVITITGNQEQIQYGQFLMQQSVRQYSGKHAT